MGITIYDIARQANISYTSVSKILNSNKPHRYSEETVERVKLIAQKLKYKPHQFAKSLKTGKTNMLGVTIGGSDFLREFSDPYISKIYSGIGETVEEQGYKLVFHHFKNNQEETIDLTESNMVDGLIVILFANKLEIFKKHYTPLLNTLNIPFVIIHNLNEDIGFNNVGLNGIQGGVIAAEHLISHGYETIGFVRTRSNSLIEQQLYQGYCLAMEKHSKPVLEKYLFVAQKQHVKRGYHLAEQILQEGRELPRALLTINDALAYGMIRKFVEAGIRVPEDVAFIGNGSELDQRYYTTDLASIKHPGKEKGRKAAEILLGNIEKGKEGTKPQTYIFEPELEIRKSCGCENPKLSEFIND